MKLSRLSVFVDESGDFGAFSAHSPYYLFTLVFHEQDRSINDEVCVLNKRLVLHEAPIHAIHTGPLVRREEYYLNWDIRERKVLFNDLFFFATRCPIAYHTVVADKRETNNKIALSGKLSKKLSEFLRNNLQYFLSFDEIIIYYDNGQTEITTILSSVFNTLFSNVEFRQVFPIDYKLFQVADLLCTLELVNIKYDAKLTSKSEENFFGTYREFKKFYMKGIQKKLLDYSSF